MATFFIPDERVLRVFALGDGDSFAYQFRVRRPGTEWPSNADGAGWQDFAAQQRSINIPVGTAGGVYQVRIRVLGATGGPGPWCSDPEVEVPPLTPTVLTPVPGDCPPESEWQLGRTYIDPADGRRWYGDLDPWRNAVPATFDSSAGRLSYGSGSLTVSGGTGSWLPGDEKINPNDWLVCVRGMAPGPDLRDGVLFRTPELGRQGAGGGMDTTYDLFYALPDDLFQGTHQRPRFQRIRWDGSEHKLKMVFNEDRGPMFDPLLVGDPSDYRFVFQFTVTVGGTSYETTYSWQGIDGDTDPYTSPEITGSVRTRLEQADVAANAVSNIRAAVIRLEDWTGGTDWHTALIGKVALVERVVEVVGVPRGAARPYAFDVNRALPDYDGTQLEVVELDRKGIRCFMEDNLSAWVKVPLAPDSVVYEDLPSGRGCPYADRGVEGSLWFAPDGTVFRKGADPWTVDIPANVDPEGVDGIIWRASGWTRSARPTGFVLNAPQDNPGLSPNIIVPNAGQFTRFRVNSNSRMGAQFEPGTVDFIAAIEQDVGIGFRDNLGRTIVINKDNTDSQEPYQFLTGPNQAAYDFLNASDATSFDIVFYRRSMRCAGDELNPWIETRHFEGRDADGIEQVFSLAETDEPIPASQRPPRDTPYDAARDNSGNDAGFLVGGRRWFDEEQQTGVTVPYLVVMWRYVRGTPARGTLPTSEWGDWLGPVFRKNYAADGDKGDAGRDGRYVEFIYRNATADDVDVDAVTGVPTPKDYLNPPATSNANKNRDDYVPRGFTDDPRDEPVSEAYPYEFRWRRKWNHQAGRWDEFQFNGLHTNWAADGITAFVNPATTIFFGGRPLWWPLFDPATGNGGAGQRSTAVFQRAGTRLCEVQVDFDIEGSGIGDLPDFVESRAVSTDPPGRGTIWQNDDPNATTGLPWRGIRYRLLGAGETSLGAWVKADVHTLDSTVTVGDLTIDANNFGDNERCIKATYKGVEQCLYVETVRDANYDYGDDQDDHPLGVLDASSVSVAGTTVTIARDVSSRDPDMRGWAVRYVPRSSLVDGHFPRRWKQQLVLGQGTSMTISGLSNNTRYAFQWRNVGVRSNREGGRWSGSGGDDQNGRDNPSLRAGTIAYVNIGTPAALSLGVVIDNKFASVNENSVGRTLSATLAGTASGAATYTWTATAGTLTGANTATPTWTPPTSVTADTDATISVSVLRDGITATDNFTVSVKDTTPTGTLTVFIDDYELEYTAGGAGSVLSAIVTGTATGTITYQWSISPGGGSLSSTTSANPTYTPPGHVNRVSRAQIALTVRRGRATARTRENITIRPQAGAPTLRASLTGLLNSYSEGAAGTRLGVSVRGTATGTISYLWTSDVGTFDNSASATPIWTPLADVPNDSSGFVNCRVTRQGVTVHARRTVVVTNTPGSNTLHVEIQGVDRAYNTGDSNPTARAVVTGTQTGTIAYQWTSNGANIPGATSSTYSVPISQSLAATYTLGVTVTRGGLTASDRVVYVVRARSINVQIGGLAASYDEGAPAVQLRPVFGGTDSARADGRETYVWSASAGTLSSVSAKSPNWTPPADVSANTTVNFSLTVTFADSRTPAFVSDTESTIVRNVQAAADLTAEITGVAATYNEGIPFRRWSVDVGGTATGATTYAWTVSAGTLNAANTKDVQWTPGLVTADTVVTITCTVTRGGHTVTDTVRTRILNRAATTLTAEITGLAAAYDEGAAAVQLGSTVGGSATGTITYDWTTTHGVLSDRAISNPTWTPPADVPRNTAVTINLTVRRQGRTASDVAVVTVRHIAPAVSLTASITGVSPQYNEGSSGTRLGAVLGGTARGTASYLWTASQGRLSSRTSPNPIWTPPTNVSADTTVNFTLRVTREGATANATASTIVKNVTALGVRITGLGVTYDEGAGAVQLGTVITGDATGNTTYAWTASIGTLSSTTAAAPTWTPPSNVASTTNATIGVTVTRGSNTASDSRTVSVRDIPTLSASITGLAAGYDEGASGVPLAVAVGGTASGTIRYAWTASVGTLSSSTSATPTWTPPASVRRNTTATIRVTVTRSGTSVSASASTIVRDVTLNAAITGLGAGYQVGGPAATLGVRVTGTARGTITYAWTASSGTLSSRTSATPTWTPPSSVPIGGRAIIRVTVSRGGRRAVASASTLVTQTARRLATPSFTARLARTRTTNTVTVTAGNLDSNATHWRWERRTKASTSSSWGAWVDQGEVVAGTTTRTFTARTARDYQVRAKATAPNNALFADSAWSAAVTVRVPDSKLAAPTFTLDHVYKSDGIRTVTITPDSVPAQASHWQVRWARRLAGATGSFSAWGYLAQQTRGTASMDYDAADGYEYRFEMRSVAPAGDQRYMSSDYGNAVDVVVGKKPIPPPQFTLPLDLSSGTAVVIITPSDILTTPGLVQWQARWRRRDAGRTGPWRPGGELPRRDRTTPTYRWRVSRKVEYEVELRALASRHNDNWRTGPYGNAQRVYIPG